MIKIYFSVVLSKLVAYIIILSKCSAVSVKMTCAAAARQGSIFSCEHDPAPKLCCFKTLAVCDNLYSLSCPYQVSCSFRV
jgi:hypothetical protein